MKKALSSIVVAIISMFIFSPSVFALQETGVQGGPYMVSGMYVNTSVWSLTTPNYSSVQGSKTGVIYSGFSSLSTALQSNSSRVLTIKMMEYDVAPNENDLVKTYKGSFSGRTLTNIWLQATNAAGNIDSAGDTTAELFLSAYISRITGDSMSTDARIFWYNMYVN